MIVVDAMVLNYGLIRHPQFSDDVDAVQTKDPTWSGPPIWKSEQRNVLMKYVRATDPRIPRTDIDLEDAQAYMEDAEAWMRTVGLRPRRFFPWRMGPDARPTTASTSRWRIDSTCHF